MHQDLSEALASFDNRLKYRYDLFISYSSGQADEAEALYNELSKSMMVFFAPITLKSLDHQPGQYVEVLTDALMQSCQVLVLLSESYLESSWCQLELYGYFNLYLESPDRRLWIVALGQGTESKIAGQFVPFLHPRQDALEKLLGRHHESPLKRGDKFAERLPPELYLDLPLYELYEPPTAANRPPWGKNARSPHGVPGAPPYEVYQQLVREYMVQLLRRGDNPFEHDQVELSIPMVGVDERYDYMKTDARRDASHLLGLGISPYAGRAKINIHGMFAKVMQAHLDKAPITSDMNFHEALARICMGDLHEGIEKMEMAIQRDPQSRTVKYYKTELARAKLISKDFDGALATLESIDIEFEPEILVREAALGRLDRLTDSEKARNRGSDISIEKIRIWSLLEDREQLDYWAESLELAGYSR